MYTETPSEEAHTAKTTQQTSAICTYAAHGLKTVQIRWYNRIDTLCIVHELCVCVKLSVQLL